MNTLWKPTLKLWVFCMVKIPLIFWLRPKVVFLTPQEVIVRIALNRRSQNHLKSMYFGALCVGADIAGAIQVMMIKEAHKKLSIVFKEVKGEFLKRPEADVYFICKDGDLIQKAVEKALTTHERENVTVQVIATTPSLLKDEAVARFALTLSLKYRVKKPPTG